MNGFWMDGSWWEYMVVAIAFSLFFVYFWCAGIWYEAMGIYKKNIPDFVHRLYLLQKKRMDEKFNTREQVIPYIWIARGISIAIGTAFFLGFQLYLWINYTGDHVTLDRALLVQLTMFLPFLLFNYFGIYFFRRYLLNLPERKDTPTK